MTICDRTSNSTSTIGADTGNDPQVVRAAEWETVALDAEQAISLGDSSFGNSSFGDRLIRLWESGVGASFEDRKHLLDQALLPEDKSFQIVPGSLPHSSLKS